MKYVFLSLLLLNVLYALWQLQVGTPVSSESLARPVEDVAQPRMVARPRAVSEPDAAPALCVSLGRFDSIEEAQQLRQRLLVLGVGAVVQTREVVVGTDYWLVMPVIGGERHAVLQLSALQEQGLDSFLITRGEMAGQL